LPVAHERTCLREGVSISNAPKNQRPAMIRLACLGSSRQEKSYNMVALLIPIHRFPAANQYVSCRAHRVAFSAKNQGQQNCSFTTQRFIEFTSGAGGCP